MLLMGKIALFATGVLLIVGLAMLIWTISCIYWFIEEAEHRASLLTYIADAESKNDLSWKATLEGELAERKWYDAPVMAAMVLLYVAVYGIFSPFWLFIDLFYWASEQISKLFPKATV